MGIVFNLIAVGGQGSGFVYESGVRTRVVFVVQIIQAGCDRLRDVTGWKGAVEAGLQRLDISDRLIWVLISTLRY